MHLKNVNRSTIAKDQEEMRIVLISPHRDDAAFSLSLAIDAWAEAGHTVTVLNCFTCSEYAPYANTESVPPAQRMRYISELRRREDLAWSGSYNGAVKLVDMGLRDAPLRLTCAIDQVCTQAVVWDEAMYSQVQRTIMDLSPEALILPLALGNHVDHITARDAAMACATGDLPCAFYEDLPYAARPGAIEEIGTRVQEIDLGLGFSFTEAPHDVGDAIDHKLSLISSYESQIDAATATQIAFFCERHAGRERLWANDLWRASVLSVGNLQGLSANA
jgi:LmbE family N-acetylglucosaminyl deacetylase